MSKPRIWSIKQSYLAFNSWPNEVQIRDTGDDHSLQVTILNGPVGPVLGGMEQASIKLICLRIPIPNRRVRAAQGKREAKEQLQRETHLSFTKHGDTLLRVRASSSKHPHDAFQHNDKAFHIIKSSRSKLACRLYGKTKAKASGSESTVSQAPIATLTNQKWLIS